MSTKMIVVHIPLKVEVDLAEYARDYGGYPARTKDERDEIRDDIHNEVVELIRFEFEGQHGWAKVRD